MPCASMEWNELVDVALTAGAANATVETLISSASNTLVLVGILGPVLKEDDDDKVASNHNEDSFVELTGIAKELDASVLSGSLSDLLAEHKSFQHGAKLGATTPTLRVVSNTTMHRYIALGLGVPDAKDPIGFALGTAIAEACVAERKIGSAVVVLPDALVSNDALVRDLCTAFYQSLYCDNRFRTGENVKKICEELTTVTILSEGPSVASLGAIQEGIMLARGINLTKDIVNAPHNVLQSLSLADTARRIAAESDCLSVQVLGTEECQALGMGAFLGVARGSETPPQFIHITYKPPSGTIKKRVGIVGKGVLFDTGGYNIKMQMMELMKFDCGGAAAVLGAARAVGALKPDGVEAHFMVAACENMINEKAYVPSDILTAMNGTTIEVMNTDAEGRLTLADALVSAHAFFVIPTYTCTHSHYLDSSQVYADSKANCEAIIELSTLTGAQLVALGTGVSAVMTTNDELASNLAEISKKTGEKSWRLPLESSYEEMLDSKFGKCG
jgi:leucyl aminopeptidase